MCNYIWVLRMQVALNEEVIFSIVNDLAKAFADDSAVCILKWVVHDVK